MWADIWSWLLPFLLMVGIPTVLATLLLYLVDRNSNSNFKD